MNKSSPALHSRYARSISRIYKKLYRSSVCAVVLVVLNLFGGRAFGQDLLTGSDASSSQPSSPVLEDIGPDKIVWSRSVSSAPDASAASSGQANIQVQNDPQAATTTASTKSRIVQVETGLNFWTGTEWATSVAEFAQTDGGFTATNMQYKVGIGSVLNVAGSIAIRTRDDVLLQSTPVAIGLYDAQSGNSLIIGSVTNAVGTLISSNMVFFENAFAGISANVLYTIKKGTFEQDVIITGDLNPGDYGFPTNTTRVQIYTEYFNAPDPERVIQPLRVEPNETIRASMATPDLVDTVLGFGEFVMGTGSASLAGQTDGNTVPVVKEFVVRDDRTFLIESVEYTGMYPAKAHAAVKKKGNSKRNIAKVSIPRATGKRQQASVSTPREKMIAAVPIKKGSIVVDYVATIGPGLSTPTVFQGDTTYLVTGAVTCSSATTIEAGAVFKYKAGGNIVMSGALTTTSSAYRPIIFTAVDDDSVGETMNGVSNSGYTGTISSAGYANPALQFNITQSVTDVRFRYCQTAVKINSATGTSSISHAQLVSCIKGIVITGCGGSSPLALKNALFASVTNPLDSTFSGATASAQHCTFDSASIVLTNSGSVAFTNSIFANVTTMQSGSGASGSNNGFYSSPTVGSSQTSVSINPFESMKAGNYYLASSCVFRNIGTTSIDSTLATDLKKKTVYPPTLLTGTLSGTFYPAAPRDTDIPDLGYHYDPVDYIGRELSVTADGNPLYLTNGTVMAFYGNYGIQVPESGAVIAQGTPINLDRFVWYPSAQEQPTLLDSISTRASALFDVSGATSSSATKPILQFRFTDFPMLGLQQDFFKTGAAHPLNLKTLSFQDCWLRGVNLVVNSTATSFGANSVPTASFVNNLLERGTASIFNGYFTSGGTTYQNPIALTVYNNLFWQATFTLTYKDLSATSHPTWTLRDNVFDHGTVSLIGDGSYSSHITYSFDGFFSTTGSSQLTGSGDVTITALTYGSPSSPLYWRWYQNSRTPTLHDVDTGRTGANGGLYHFTTKASEGKETTSAMDLGFHYVVLGTGNVPADTDGDGIPDYLEDVNGNGTADTGETDWQTTYNSQNGLSGSTDLRVYTPLK